MSQATPQERGAEPGPLRPTGSPGRHRLRRALAITAALAAIGIAGLTFLRGEVPDPNSAFQPDGERLGPVSGTEEKPLPPGTILAFHNDEAVDAYDYVGKPLVMNFWASWCAPCIREMPEFQRLADELGEQVTVLGINAQDSAEKARAFAADLGIGFDLARDPDGDYFKAVGGIGWPTTLLVDGDGFIRYRHTGPLDADQLRDLLATHLGVDVALEAG